MHSGPKTVHRRELFGSLGGAASRGEERAPHRSERRDTGAGEVVAVAGDFFSKKFVGNGFDGAFFPPGGKT